MALTVSFSFQTVLPHILGKNKHATGQDSGLVLPCASKYSDRFDNSNGISTGTKQQIVEGLDTQMAVFEETVSELEYTHPEGAAVATRMLQCFQSLYLTRLIPCGLRTWVDAKCLARLPYCRANLGVDLSPTSEHRPSSVRLSTITIALYEIDTALARLSSQRRVGIVSKSGWSG